MTVAQEKVPLTIKLGYGLGATAYGIKDNGFATFLLLFYNQVVGLPAATVGLVIAVALVFDALIDPLLGIASDRTRTAWGRRHPWLYASIVPIALSWILLWNPPALSENGKLAWLFVTAVLTRAAIAINEVPSLALAPELSRDYHERTRVIRYRYLFGWIGGLAFLTAAYAWFLAPPRGAQTGPLALIGFGNYGTAGAIAMALAVLMSALATHRFVVSRAAAPVARQSMTQLIGAIRQTLANRAFVVLMISGVLAYTAQGVNFALSNYLLAFVWLLRPGDFVTYSIALFGGVLIAFVIVTPVNMRLGKTRATATLYMMAGMFIVAPYFLRLLDVLPAPGTATRLPILFAFFISSTATGVAAMMTGASMMSDVVEASEETTGRREEGLFFAGALFMQKCSSGIGILLTGLILSFARFPDAARPGAVALPILDRLTLLYCGVYFVLAALAALVSLRFPFGKAEHDARIARLAVAAAEKG